LATSTARAIALGYPYVPIVFLLVTAALLINTFFAAPREALRGVLFLVAGLPLYWYWSRSALRGDKP
jgi:APA family basic amino acid/polyamine antiporter